VPFRNDRRTVLTLDAGGTKLVFSAVRGGLEAVPPFSRPANGDHLDLCLRGILEGFAEVRDRLDEPPVAISFAFPGPADYPAGIVGDLPNLSAFRGGVPLGPILEERFGIPVFLNNDGDLFAYGEALAGFLPWTNGLLQEGGSPKRFQNLVGVTIGTGFGGGIVAGGRLLLGDNSGAAEIRLLPHKLEHGAYAEEGVSARAVRRVYAEKAGIPPDSAPEPETIAAIAERSAPGSPEAAREAFRRLGEVAGDALAAATTLVDGLVVLGGGLVGSARLFLPALVAEMNGRYRSLSGGIVPRLTVRVFNLENESDRGRFVEGDRRTVTVRGLGRKVQYDALRRVGIGLTRLGTSRAISVGAYAFALEALEKGAEEGIDTTA
jgi:glucokinase